MALIIEKVVAGEDAVKSQEEFATAMIDADANRPTKEFLEAREARAIEEAELNLKTNSLIFPQPGETIATRVVEVPDEEAEQLDSSSRVVDTNAFVDGLVQAETQDVASTTTEEGATEEAVDHQAGSKGAAQTSPAASSSVAGSGVGNKEGLEDHRHF